MVNQEIFTLGVGELNNNIILKDVNFFNSWNGINSNPLEGALELLVISCIGLVHSLLLPTAKYQMVHININHK